MKYSPGIEIIKLAIENNLPTLPTDLNNVDFLVEIVDNHHGKDNYLLSSYNNLPLDNGINIELVNFEASLKQGEIDLTWMTSNELNNAGYRLWRGTDDGSGGYTNITTLIGISSRQVECAEGSLMVANLANTNHLIPAIGNSRENCGKFKSDGAAQ